jgi:pimeloyl-ACP methyl ester carboxylesterase
MMSPPWALRPLENYLQNCLDESEVHTISLGLSLAEFEKILSIATDQIRNKLGEATTINTIVLFGHSFGGRVAAELAYRLQDLYPLCTFVLITAGTPMGKRPDNLPWYHSYFFNMSSAYRAWPEVRQPGSSVAICQIGFYSLNDTIVTPEFARLEYQGELRKLSGLSHHDLIVPAKVGELYLAVLRTVLA